MRRFAWIPYLVVALLAMLPHYQALGYEFVFDDDFLVVQNAFLREPWSPLRAFGVHFWEGTPFAALYYRPIVNAALALNGKLLGWGPAGFHLVNILLHAANSALVVWLLRRLGAGRVAAMLAGVVLNFVCIGIALAGIDVANFWAALFLLGVGWNFLYIGATALLTETYRPAEKAKAQGANDMLIFLTMATSSFSSGMLLEANGWQLLNYLAIPFVAAIGFALLWLMTKRRVPAVA